MPAFMAQGVIFFGLSTTRRRACCLDKHSRISRVPSVDIPSETITSKSPVGGSWLRREATHVSMCSASSRQGTTTEITGRPVLTLLSQCFQIFDHRLPDFRIRYPRIDHRRSRGKGGRILEEALQRFVIPYSRMVLQR